MQRTPGEILVRAVLILLLGMPVATFGQDPNVCDEPGDFPDVIVGSIHQVRTWGSSAGISAFSIGTTSCNVGTCWLNWIQDTSEHPVIAQNMFRLKDGRFEQIGQSWLKHGFFALSFQLCAGGCIGTDGTHLGVNCSDPYSSGLNGSQSGLGPKFEVNPSTGSFPYPFSPANSAGVLSKRLQVHHADLDPQLNAGAQYFVEAQYISSDDSAAGMDLNNASYRPIDVVGTAPNFFIQTAGVTEREKPAIEAWAAADPEVRLMNVDLPHDGRFIVGMRISDLGNGTWHYEYAVQNLNSHRSARAFRVPIPRGTNVTNIGFHDVDYHSGEPYDGTDWEAALAGGQLIWSTSFQFENENANALRWGTLYNFRFDADRPPIRGTASLSPFRNDLGSNVSFIALVPDPYAESIPHGPACPTANP